MTRFRVAATFMVIPVLVVTIAALRPGPMPRPINQIEPIDPTCTSSSPCIEYDNNATGPGIRGISIGGNGLAGATKWNSTSVSNGREGLIGNDISSSGSFNAGVRGLSVRGTGVAGQSSNGSGVAGVSTSGVGVTGTSTNSQGGNFSGGTVGILASSNAANGIEGRATASVSTRAGIQGDNNASTIAVRAFGFGGPLFVGNNSHAVDVFKVDDAGNTTFGKNISTAGSLTVGTTLTTYDLFGEATSQSIGLYAQVGSIGGSGGFAAFDSGIITAEGGGGPLFIGNSSGSINSFKVDDNGNVTITGELFTAGTCSTGCARDSKAAGARVVTYVPHEATPITEDFGQAQLVNGRAFVALDPAFRDVINQRVDYVVFITPEGDSNGLYVTQKSSLGFTVRESQSGHSTLLFSYRIVARPFDSSAPRLARMEFQAQPKRTLEAPGPVPLTRTPKKPIQARAQ